MEVILLQRKRDEPDDVTDVLVWPDPRESRDGFRERCRLRMSMNVRLIIVIVEHRLLVQLTVVDVEE